MGRSALGSSTGNDEVLRCPGLIGSFEQRAYQGVRGVGQPASCTGEVGPTRREVLVEPPGDGRQQQRLESNRRRARQNWLDLLDDETGLLDQLGPSRCI